MKIHRLIPWAACIVLLIFTVGNCRGRKQAENKADNVRDYLTDSIHYYKLKNGKQAAKISALNGDNASLELLLSETSSQLKEITRKYNRVDAAIEIKTVTKIDTAHQRYTDTIKYEFKRDWTIQSEWYKIQGTSTQLGNTINSIKIPNDLSIAVGQEGSKYTITATNSNPYIKAAEMKSFTLKTKPTHWGVGLIGGYGIGKSGATYFVGAGIYYRLFGF